MTNPTDFKFRAFLSYSHADTPLAKWLHSGLERFPLRGLSGRETAPGPVPKQLRPIFRDREDFSAGQTLNDQTLAALDASAALIVLCSPASAKSAAVNEEVRLFKHRCPKRLIVPIILAGKPNSAQECFPPALKFKLDADGQVTNQPADVPIAPDIPEEGRELVLAKVVASLIGLPSDEVYRRAERERKRQARIRYAVLALVLLLTCVGGYFIFRSKERGAVLIDTAAACARYLPEAQASAGRLNALDQCIKTLELMQKGAASDPRDAEILKLIDQGKKGEAERLQVEAAQDDEAAGLARTKKAAERYRGIAATAGLADPKKARDYYARAAKLDPDNILGMMWHAQMENEAGNLAEAERAYSAVSRLGVKGKDDHELLWASLGIGDIRAARGELAGALKAYQNAEGDGEGLAKADPANAGWQRDLSASYEKVGDVLKDQGNLTDALTTYRDGLAIAERLAKADPGGAGWQHDLSVSYNKVGGVLKEQGNLGDALKAYRDSLAIAERLTKADPANASWQHEFAVTRNFVGNVLMAQGKLAEALTEYRGNNEILERLAKADPANAGWQRDLSVSYEKVGDVLKDRGNLTDALTAYRDSLSIRERLAKADPGHAGWQRDLSVAYIKVGDVLVAQGNLPEALNAYRDSSRIAERLAKADPGNAGWQRDLSVAYNKVGDVLKEQGNLPEALKAYRDSLAIFERLAKSDPGNAGWQVDVAFAYWRLARYGDKPAENWQKVIDILQRQDGEGRLAPVHKKWLDQAKAQLAALEGAAEIKAAFEAGDFAKAAALQTERAGAVEKDEAEKNGKAGPLTGQLQGNVAWYLLFAREFEQALAASERGRALAPDKLWIATNRAHALMFLGRAEEARAAYLEQKGKHVSGQGMQDKAVLKDFAEFEKRGLTHQQMAEIRQLLAPAASQQWGTAIEKTQNGLGGAR
jgi:tetratricopeptide (TPR) repeat protein